MAAMQKKSGIHLAHIYLQPAPTAQETGGASDYDFVAPLDAQGRLDAEAWKRDRALCFVHRLEGGEIVARGLLVHRPGGAGGGTWAFDYEPGLGDEDSGFHFEARIFAPGEYVSVRDADGKMHTCRVSTVKPA